MGRGETMRAAEGMVVAKFSAPEIGGLITGIAENGDSLDPPTNMEACSLPRLDCG